MRQVIIFPGEDGFWVAECPSLPGCISQGESREAAVANIREAIEGYVLALFEGGLPIPMMTYKGYDGAALFDEDAKIFHGEVGGLRDVVTFQAKSADELETAFRESIDDYLEFCESRGGNIAVPAVLADGRPACCAR